MKTRITIPCYYPLAKRVLMLIEHIVTLHSIKSSSNLRASARNVTCFLKREVFLNPGEETQRDKEK